MVNGMLSEKGHRRPWRAIWTVSGYWSLIWKHTLIPYKDCEFTNHVTFRYLTYMCLSILFSTSQVMRPFHSNHLPYSWNNVQEPIVSFHCSNILNHHYGSCYIDIPTKQHVTIQMYLFSMNFIKRYLQHSKYYHVYRYNEPFDIKIRYLYHFEN